MGNFIRTIQVYFFAALSFTGIAFAKEAGIRDFSYTPLKPAQYSTITFNALLSAKTLEVKDTNSIDLSMQIRGHDGIDKTLVFFYSGKGSLWEARLTPVEAGDYTYNLTLEISGALKDTMRGSFSVSKTPGDSFLRRSKNNNFYLSFDSGRKFFGIGHNLGWVQGDDPLLYEKYFSAMKAGGCNIARVWSNTEWALPVETKKIGVYDYNALNNIDCLLDLAKKYGIYIIFVLDTYGSLMPETGDWSEGNWHKNPYNRSNGGPCASPEEFFTSASARSSYKQKLRLIMSRYGYSANILAFELWNEMDAPADWIREVSSYARSVNPHGQIITSSAGYPWGNNFDETSMFAMKDIGIVDRHIYGNQTNDLISNIISVNRELSKKLRKPIVVGEFGMDACKDDRVCDPEGKAAALHSSLWASCMSGAFSTALNWWWNTYIKPKDLYVHYRAVKNFTDDLDFSSTRVSLPDLPVVRRKLPAGSASQYSDVTVGTKEFWGHTAYKEFTIQNDGDVQGGIVNYYLQGDTNKHMKISPIFHVDYPADGEFVLDVGVVSQHSLLYVYIDDKLAVKQEFTTGPDKGPWQRSMFRKDMNIYQCIYNSSVSVKVPKGKHKVVLSNMGLDWMGIKKIRLVRYADNSFSNVRLAGLSIDGSYIFWIQNKDYTWQNARRNAAPEVIENAYFEIKNIANGKYKIEWWDTIKGEVVTVVRGSTDDNALIIGVPPFQNDIACKVRPEK